MRHRVESVRTKATASKQAPDLHIENDPIWPSRSTSLLANHPTMAPIISAVLIPKIPIHLSSIFKSNRFLSKYNICRYVRGTETKCAIKFSVDYYLVAEFKNNRIRRFLLRATFRCACDIITGGVHRKIRGVFNRPNASHYGDAVVGSKAGFCLDSEST